MTDRSAELQSAQACPLKLEVFLTPNDIWSWQVYTGRDGSVSGCGFASFDAAMADAIPEVWRQLERMGRS